MLGEASALPRRTTDMVGFMRILFVCLGNICRSPTAEAAMKEAAADAGLDLVVDSAGTGSWHVGDSPDPRMRSAAADMDLIIDGVARQVRPADFEEFDLLVAMDRQNLRDLEALAPGEEAARKLRLFRQFQPDADGQEVPDPYYGGPEGFNRVVRIARESAAGLVAAIREGRV